MFQRIKSLLFENRTAKQTVAKNTFWLASSNIGGRLLRAIIIIYAARILGATDWGVFSYALTMAAFLTIFMDLGINHILMREVAKKPSEEERIKLISTGFVLKLGLLALGVLGILFIAPNFTSIDEAVALLPLVALILAFDSLRDFGFWLIRAREKMEWEAGLFLLTNLSIVIFGFVFLQYSRSVESIAYAYTLGTGVGMAATFMVLRKSLKGVFSNFSAGLVKFIAFAAWPFAVSGLLGGLMLNTDVLVLGWLRTAEEVGLYSAAQRIIQILYILPATVAVSALPLFARLVLQDRESFRKALERLIAVAFLMSLPLMVGGILLAPEVIDLVFGGGYANASLAFAILLATLIIDFPSLILSNAIFAHNKQGALTIYAAIGGGANLILDIILIPYFGIAGAAAATFFCQLLSNIYLWWTLKRIQPFRVLPRIKKALVAVALMGVGVYIFDSLGVHTILTVLGGGAIYLGALYVMKEPIADDLRVILKRKPESSPAN